jgi:O-antigen/teichoic acid export membrane protein
MAFASLLRRSQELARRPAAWGYGWKALNAFASFAAAAVLARAAGAEAIGHYGLAVATAALFATVGQRGLDQVLMRVVGGDLREGDTAAAAAAWRLLGRRMLAGTLTMSALMLLLVLEGSLAQRLGADRASLLVASLGVVSLPLLRLALATARVLGRPAFAQFLEALPSLLFLPAVIVVALVPLVLDGPRIVGLFYLSQLAAVVVALVPLRRARAAWGAPGSAPEAGPLMRSGLPIMATALLLAFQDWFLLAATTAGLSAADAGALRLALQLMLIPSMIWQVGDSFIIAQLAGDLRQDNRQLAWWRFWRAVRRSLLLASPVIALLLFAPGPVLRLLFGEPFVHAAPMVALMALGQLAIMVAHPVGAMLVMAERELLLFAVMLAGIVVLVALVTALLPTLGLLGIGIAYAASLATRSALGLAIARRVVGTPRT